MDLRQAPKATDEASNQAATGGRVSRRMADAAVRHAPARPHVAASHGPTPTSTPDRGAVRSGERVSETPMGCWLAEMVKFVETVSLSGNQRAESTSAHAMAWGRTDRDDITAARTRAPWTPPAPAGRLRAGAAELTHDGHARRTPPQPLTADLLDRAGRKRNGLGLGTGPPSPSASVSPRRYRASPMI